MNIPPNGLLLGRRGGQANVFMDWDVLVSRHHARIWAADGEIWLEDLNSKNGTFVSGERLTHPIVLDADHAVLVGDTLITLAPEQEGARTPAPRTASPPPIYAARIEPMSHAGQALRAEGQIGASSFALAAVDRPPQGLSQAFPPLHPYEPLTYAGLPLHSPEPDMARQTLDLRPIVEEAPPVPERPAPPKVEPKKEKPVRHFPRFTRGAQVEIAIQEREDLRTLWVEDISKGGLFVRTNDPPARGRKVQVKILTPEGSLDLTAEVVHVIDERMAVTANHPAGVGLQFTDLTQEKRRAINRYVDGLERLGGASERTPTPTIGRGTKEEVLAAAKTFLAALEKNDIYAALGLNPKSSDEQIKAKLAELKPRFLEAPPDASPAQQARVSAAAAKLERVSAMLSDPLRRLDYDFRSGYVRAIERIQEANQANAVVKVADLREVWMKVFPGHHERAGELARRAVMARRKNDFMTAVLDGRAALELDPFHEELRRTVAAWERMVS